MGGYPSRRTTVALEATAGAAGPDRQYAGLRQCCVLYTDATRALCRTRVELWALNRREVKGAVRAEKRGGKLAAPYWPGRQGPQVALTRIQPTLRGGRLREGYQ